MTRHVEFCGVIVIFGLETVLGSAGVVVAIVVGAAGILFIPAFCHFKFVLSPGKQTFVEIAGHFQGESIQQGILKYPIVCFSHDGISFRVESVKSNKHPDYQQLGLNISAEWPDPGFRMKVCRKTLFSRFQPFSSMKAASTNDDRFDSKLTLLIEKEADIEMVFNAPMKSSILRMVDAQRGIDQNAKPLRSFRCAKPDFLFDLDIVAGRITLDCGIDIRQTDHVLNLIEEFCDFYFLAVETTRTREKK